MGGSESKNSDKPSLLSKDEENSAKRLYSEFNDVNMFKKKITSYLGETMTKNLLFAISHMGGKAHKGKDGSAFSYQQFESFIGLLFKGSNAERAAILKVLCAGKGEDVQSEELYSTILELSKGYRTVSRHLDIWKCWSFKKSSDTQAQEFAFGILRELFLKGFSHKEAVPLIEVPENTTYSEDELEEWISRSPLFLHVFEVVFMTLFPLEPNRKLHTERVTSLLPVPSIAPGGSSLLNEYSLIFLNSHLRPELQKEWRMLFSNHKSGDSFTKLVSHIVGRGPSLLIVRDKHGHIFGGFAEQKWELKSKFYGSESNFLFTLSPQYGIYQTTSYNTNFMYLNQGQKTIPNGLGMGGQFGYCGLWIDESFNHGHSKAQPRSTTYGSPQLSATSEFEVDTVEVWELGPVKKPDSDDEDEEEKKKKFKSVLDSEVEAKAMLEIMGKHQVSEGLRESDEEEMTEEMKKKMNTLPSLI